MNTTNQDTGGNTRPVEGQNAPALEHRPLTLETGPFECLERECEEYYGEDGVEDLTVERCSHITDVMVCGGCTPERNDGEYEKTVPWPCPAAAAVAGSAA